MKYRIIIEQDEDGAFVVECPALPGCISQGRTRKEAIENIQDAIRANHWGVELPCHYYQLPCLFHKKVAYTNVRRAQRSHLNPSKLSFLPASPFSFQHEKYRSKRLIRIDRGLFFLLSESCSDLALK